MKKQKKTKTLKSPGDGVNATLRNVRALKKQIADLDRRVTALEAPKVAPSDQPGPLES